jgi:type I restriction enzyme R subunit
VERAWNDPFWRYLADADIDFLRNKVGPLLRYAPGQDVPAQTFVSKVERLKLQILTRKDPQPTAQSIAKDVRLLPNYVFEDESTRPPAELCLSPGLLAASVADLNRVIDVLADQMKNRRKEEPQVDLLDLSDMIETKGYIILRSRPEPIFYEDYRQLVTQRVLDLVANHPVITAIDRGEPVTDLQLIELERTLREELGNPPLELNEENIRRAYRMQVNSMLEFLRDLLELDGIPDYEEIVKRQFSQFLAAHPFNGNQVRFLRGVQQVLLQKRRLRLADLYEPPLDSFGADAVERWFRQEQITEILAFTETLAV